MENPWVNLNILVIEDNDGDAALIKEFLSDECENCIIHREENLRDARKILEKPYQFDVILLDLSLPDAEGADLVNQVVKGAKSAPVIVLTGFADKKFGIEAISIGASDYLLKDELTASLLHKSIIYTLERNKIRGQLKASEKKYRTLFELSPTPMWVYSIDNLAFLDVNEAAISHYGYSKSEFLQMTIKDIRPSEDIPSLLEAIKLVKSGKDRYSRGHYRHVKKNGERIVVRVESNKVNFQNIQAELVLAVDVTFQMDNEARIEKVNLRLEKAEALAKMGYWETDLKTNQTYYSNEFLNITGIKNQKNTKSFKAFVDVIDPLDRLRYNEAVEKCQLGNLKMELEIRIVLPKNVRKVLNIKAEFIKLGNTLYRFEGIIQDITRRRAEANQIRLQESIISNASEGVIITEVDPLNHPGPRIVFVNDAMCQLSGYKQTELIGKTPRIFQGPDTNRDELIRMRKAIENNKSCEIEVVNYHKNGTPYWVNIVVNPVTDHAGLVTHFVALERNVTERRNYVEKLKIQNATLREIAWTQSHVVRAPLSRLMGLVDLIVGHMEHTELEQLLGYIRTSAEELDAIIKNIVQKTSLIDTKEISHGKSKK